MIYAIFIGLYFILAIVTMIFHIKTTTYLRDKVGDLRTKNSEYINQLTRVREEYHQLQLNVMQRGGAMMRFGAATDGNDPVYISEDTARVALLKLYHIAKTDPKGLSLRSAVLNWNHKHNKPRNIGE